MKVPQVAPWQLWWATFDPQVGREQVGPCPAVVVGTAFACRLPNGLVFVVPCTTTDRGLPFHPQVTALDQATFALCDQLKSICRQRLVRRHRTRLAAEDIDAIRFALRMMIDTH